MVSVIIPNYNHAKYLDARIQSILNQSYRDFEIIILDDCSTDNSKDIMEKYRDNAFVTHIVYNEHNSGSTFKQWEKGFELAKGELVWIAESDDCCDTSFLEALVPKFRNKNVVLAFSRSLKFSDEGDLGIHHLQMKLKESFESKGVDFIKQYLSKVNVVANASSAIIRKSIIKNLPNDYCNYRGCGDWLFWIYIAEQGNVYYEAKSLNHFRQHLSNTTNHLNKSGNNQREVLKIYNYLSEKEYIKGIRKKYFRAILLESCLSNDKLDNRDVRKSVLDEWNISFTDYAFLFLVKPYRWLMRLYNNYRYSS